MKRLTERDKNGTAMAVCCGENCKYNFCCENGGFAECGDMDDIIDRLAAIEDILGDEYNLDRLRELVQADREGRCVVLDVKIGQKMWILYAEEYGDDETAQPLEVEVDGISLNAEHEVYYFVKPLFGMYIDPFSHKDIGKTVFLTRAEAEAALRREQDG